MHEAVNEGMVELFYCSTDVMIADVLTKPLSRGRFEALELYEHGGTKYKTLQLSGSIVNDVIEQVFSCYCSYILS